MPRHVDETGLSPAIQMIARIAWRDDIAARQPRPQKSCRHKARPRRATLRAPPCSAATDPVHDALATFRKPTLF
jgi:hypothetical protein